MPAPSPEKARDVIDVRNGLYVLHYTGPGAEAVDAVGFLEGNAILATPSVFRRDRWRRSVGARQRYLFPRATVLVFDA